MVVELPLCVLECCVVFSGVKLSIRSFNLLLKHENFFKNCGTKKGGLHMPNLKLNVSKIIYNIILRNSQSLKSSNYTHEVKEQD